MLENGTAQFTEFVVNNDVKLLPGSRSIVIVDIHQVGSSCGFSVPIFDFKEHRQILNDHMAKKEEKFKAGNEKESFDRWVALRFLIDCGLLSRWGFPDGVTR